MTLTKADAMARTTIFRFLIVTTTLLQLAFDTELTSNEDSPKKKKPYKCKLFDALLDNGGKWSGTLTIGEKEMKVACLTVTSAKICDTCDDRGVFLDFDFDGPDKLPRFANPRPIFGLKPIVDGNKLFVAEKFHGVMADLTYGSELIFISDRANKSEKGEYAGNIQFYYDNHPHTIDESAPPTVTAKTVIRLRDGRLTGNITGEKLEAINFKFERLPIGQDNSQTE